MLRASAKTASIPVDLRSISDRSIDPKLPAGPQLLDFVDALVRHDSAAALDTARRNLTEEVGVDGAARAALVTGNFEMMNRILDATGVPVPNRMADITAELGLSPFTGRG